MEGIKAIVLGEQQDHEEWSVLDVQYGVVLVSASSLQS